MPKFTSKYIQAHIAAYDERTKDYKFLILKRGKNVRPYPSIWQVITGNIEKNETAFQAAMREFDEETGMTPLKIWTIPYLTTFFDAFADEINASPVFGILVEINEKVKLSEEHVEYMWVDYDRCRDMLILPTHCEGTKFFRNAILNMDDQSTFSCDLKF